MELTVKTRDPVTTIPCQVGIYDAVKVRFGDVENIDEITVEIAKSGDFDPGLLVNGGNIEMFLDTIGREKVKEYFGLVEKMDKAS